MDNQLWGYAKSGMSLLYENDDIHRLEIAREYIIDRLEGGSLVCDLREKDMLV